MADEPDNVIEAQFKGEGLTVRPAHLTPNKRYCSHPRYTLDEDARTVACAVCDKHLDCFEVLLDYAQRTRNMRTLEFQCREARERLADLKQEEARVKARTRNAARKDAELALEAARAKLRERERRTAKKARQIAELARRIERAMQDA